MCVAHLQHKVALIKFAVIKIQFYLESTLLKTKNKRYIESHKIVYCDGQSLQKWIQLFQHQKKKKEKKYKAFKCETLFIFLTSIKPKLGNTGGIIITSSISQFTDKGHFFEGRIPSSFFCIVFFDAHLEPTLVTYASTMMKNLIYIDAVTLHHPIRRPNHHSEQPWDPR